MYKIQNTKKNQSQTHLVTKGVHESSKERIVHVAMDTALYLGNDAVHVIQEVMENDQEAAHPVQFIPASRGGGLGISGLDPR